MKHALVIGGSGMLSGAVLWLAEQGYQVSVVGRNVAKLERLTNRHPALYPVAADYYDLDRFSSVLQGAVAKRGNFSRVVAWIHQHEEKIISRLAEDLFPDPAHPWELFHVLGSSSNLEEIEKQLQPPANCRYHQIKLGFVLEGDRSRWLTHDEISNGVIEGMRSGRKVTIVGTLTPWSKRP